MADRISQLYNVAAVFVSPTATGFQFNSGNSGQNLLTQIPRLQSVGFNINRPTAPIPQLGQFASVDRVQVEAPSVGVNMEWFAHDGKAENALGLNTYFNAPIPSGFLDRTTLERNAYIMLAKEGVDAINGATSVPSGENNVIGLGNMYMNNYSVTLAIGAPPRATASFDAFNAEFYTGNVMNYVPAIDPTTDQLVDGKLFTCPPAISYTGADIYSVIRPGEITLEVPRTAGLGDFMSGQGTININSVTISTPIPLDAITRLGKMFPVSRYVGRPIDYTVSFDATAADVAQSSLAQLRCNETLSNFRVVLRSPSCGPTGAPAIIYDIRQPRFESRDYSISAGGGAATVRYNFVGQIGGIGSTTAGVFMSGTHMWHTGL